MNTKTHLHLRMIVVRFDHQMGAADESIEVDCLLEMVCFFFFLVSSFLNVTTKYALCANSVWIEIQ